MVSSVYFAAALFSSRETLFNSELATRLKRAMPRNVRLFLPQEDGFEFSSLGAELRKRLPEAEVGPAVNAVIYTLDMGGFLSRSDAVLAVLDEPLDDGVLVEISYARRLGIPVLGIRTDRRAPYGVPGDTLGGIHFFAAYQCTHYVMADLAGSVEQLDSLADFVVRWLASLGKHERGPGDAVLEAAAARLFSDVDVVNDDLHSAGVLSRIIDNYLKRPELFARLAPKVSTPAAVATSGVASQP
jgi:nucleoside 2-deoxyribosyltransferase